MSGSVPVNGGIRARAAPGARPAKSRSNVAGGRATRRVRRNTGGPDKPARVCVRRPHFRRVGHDVEPRCARTRRAGGSSFALSRTFVVFRARMAPSSAANSSSFSGCAPARSRDSAGSLARLNNSGCGTRASAKRRSSGFAPRSMPVAVSGLAGMYFQSIRPDHQAESVD
jgi:hypothetical protein